jgi:hypothetical protein
MAKRVKVLKRDDSRLKEKDLNLMKWVNSEGCEVLGTPVVLAGWPGLGN